MDNKELFKSIVSQTITRPGINELMAMLEAADFFEAPASTIYHAAYPGGLCVHSINVFNNLVALANTFAPGKYSMETLAIVSLFHDVAKINTYKVYNQAKKVYSPTGSKYDSIGRYDWTDVVSYKIAEKPLRYVAGSHGFNSYMRLKDYIKLEDEEIIAIMSHHGSADKEYIPNDLDEIYNRYTLALLLHQADMLACYINERGPILYEKDN